MSCSSTGTEQGEHSLRRSRGTGPDGEWIVPSHRDSDAATLGDYALLLKRRWPSVVAGLILGSAIAVVFMVMASRTYTSHAAVLVTATNSNAMVQPGQNQRTHGINMDTEARLVTSTETLTIVADSLGLSRDDLADLPDSVTVTVPPNSEILDVSFSAPTAIDAQRGAQAFASAYLDHRRVSAENALQEQGASLQRRIDAVSAELQSVAQSAAALPPDSAQRAVVERRATLLNNQLASLGGELDQVQSTTVTPGRIVSDAEFPSVPSNRDPKLTVAAGAALGLLLGLIAAYLRQRADDRIRNPRDLTSHISIPLLDVLPQPLAITGSALLDPASPNAVAVARLRNLISASRSTEPPPHVVLVAGVRQGGGPIAVHLAASLARTGLEVRLLCADVHGSTVNDLLGGRSPGVAEVMSGDADLSDAWRTFDGLPNLRVLVSGMDPDRASSLLQTAGASALLHRVSEGADYVILEAPATTVSPDAQTLARLAGTTVLVVESGRHIRARHVVDAYQQLESMRTLVLGAVMVRYTTTKLVTPGPR